METRLVYMIVFCYAQCQARIVAQSISDGPTLLGYPMSSSSNEDFSHLHAIRANSLQHMNVSSISGLLCQPGAFVLGCSIKNIERWKTDRAGINFVRDVRLGLTL